MVTRKSFYISIFAITLALLSTWPLTASAQQSSNIETAKAWLTAYYTSRPAFTAMVQENMASDGVVMNNRFVGFGFISDTVLSREEGRRVVTEVFPGGPASGTLKIGDEFISIGGIPVTKESIQGDKLPTRGKIGEAVAVVIKRDGKEMPIEVIRGKVSGALTMKHRLLADLSRGKADQWYWKNSKIQIEEVIGDANVLYARYQVVHTDAVSKLPFEVERVLRFTFNNEGKITSTWRLSEERFQLEQMGYTFSR